MGIHGLLDNRVPQKQVKPPFTAMAGVFLWGLLTGICALGIMVLPLIGKLNEQRAELAVALQKQIKATDTCLQKLDELNSASTLIFEPDPPEGAAAAASFLASRMGISLPAVPGQLLPRWVTPRQNGAHAGRATPR